MDGSKTGQEWRGPLSEVKHPARPAPALPAPALPAPARPFGEMAELLVPPPKDVRPGSSSFVPAEEIRFCWQAADGPMAAVVFAGLAAAFGAWGVRLRRVEQLPAEVLLRREERSDDEGYDLEIGAAGVQVRAGGERGLFHGGSTLKQWLRLERSGSPPNGGAEIRGVGIADRPALRQRGVLLDVSRNRVPTMAQLERTVEVLAELKINQLQLYMEHSFAYRGHEEVWREASPFSGEEIASMDAFCRARGIELVPCQNSFGHFHRWLRHDKYRPLAEVPAGIEHPFSLEAEPFSLCPLDPGSLALLEDLYGQLLPHFASGLFNSGLDETFDLGRGRSKEAVEERGRASVYVDFLNAVNALAERMGRRMMFWGDVVLEHPELLPRLPQQGIVLEWGYEADHPFSRDSRRFGEAGLDFYVCPGTSSWNSFGGRTTNALRNLAAAARAGALAGALGMLITDWGDHGHLQPPPISWPGLFYGAACAWNLAASERPFDVPLARWLDEHLFGDPAGVLGGTLLRLGELYRLTGANAVNGSPLFFALMMPHKKAAERRGIGMRAERLENAREVLAEIREDLPRSRAKSADAGLVRSELDWVARTLDHAARFAILRLAAGEDLPLGGLPAPLRKNLRDEHLALGEDLRPLWLARSRPGGLEESLERFLLAARLLA
jgi:hexosaminidase